MTVVHTMTLAQLGPEELIAALWAGAYRRDDWPYAEAIDIIVGDNGEDEGDSLAVAAPLRGRMWAERGCVYVHFDQIAAAMEEPGSPLNKLVSADERLRNRLMDACATALRGTRTDHDVLLRQAMRSERMSAVFAVDGRMRVVLPMGDVVLTFVGRRAGTDLDGPFVEFELELRGPTEHHHWDARDVRTTETGIMASLLTVAHRVLTVLAADRDAYRSGKREPASFVTSRQFAQWAADPSSSLDAYIARVDSFCALKE